MEIKNINYNIGIKRTDKGGSTLEERRRSNRKPSGMGGKGKLFAIFGVLIIGMFGSIYSAQNDKPTEVKKEVKAEDKKENKKPEFTADLEHATPETISNELKKYSEDIKGAKVRNKTLIVTYKDSGFWSENTLLDSYALDSIRLIKQLYKNKNFDLFAFERPTVMTDDNGNEKMETVLKSYYTRDKLDQMNLDNFSDMVLMDTERYFQKSSGYWIHLGLFNSLKKDMIKKLNSPINFKNMDDTRYDMNIDATNDVVEQPDSVEDKEPIVAEPVTKESTTEDAKAEDEVAESSYDTGTLLSAIFNISPGFDQMMFKIDDLNASIGTDKGKVVAPLSSSLFELKSMIDATGKEIMTMQQSASPPELKNTTQQLVTNQTELNYLYSELQQQFYSIDKHDYPDAEKLASDIRNTLANMKRLTQPNIEAYFKYFMSHADEEGS